MTKRKAEKWTPTACNPTTTTLIGRTNTKGNNTMKKMLTTALAGFITMNLLADEAKQPYIINWGEQIMEVHDMPAPMVSKPISNSFVYVDGEYVEPPYIVSISNLAVCINGRIVNNPEPWVRPREWYGIGRRIGRTPENVGEDVTWTYEYYVRSLQKGTISHIAGGFPRIGMAQSDGDGGGLGIVQMARKAMLGDEQAKQALIGSMGLVSSLEFVHPDWIERLANNTNLEIRATAIIEAKREKERLEQERREQMNRKDGKTQ